MSSVECMHVYVCDCGARLVRECVDLIVVVDIVVA